MTRFAFLAIILFMTHLAEAQNDFAPVWSYKTGGKILGSPTVSDDVVFIGSDDGKLYALDTHDGKLRWSFSTKGGVHTTPAVHNKLVFFGSMDGRYYAIDKQTGKLVWKFKTGGESRMGAKGYWGMKPDSVYMEDPWDDFLSSPIVDPTTGIVYFGSSDGNIYALNGDTGKRIWSFKTEDKVHATPTLYNGVIYVGGWDTYLYALDATNGTLKWKFKTGGDPAMRGIQAAAVVENSTVYFGARDASFYALDAETGAQKWKYDANHSWVVGSCRVVNSHVYVGTSDSYLILSLNAETGAEEFSIKANGYVFSSPCLVNEHLFIGDYTGYLWDINVSTKEAKHWSTPSRNQLAATLLNNNRLDFSYLVNGRDLSLYQTTVGVMKMFDQLGPIVSSPTVVNHRLFTGSADGVLYAFDIGAL